MNLTNLLLPEPTKAAATSPSALSYRREKQAKRDGVDVYVCAGARGCACACMWLVCVRACVCMFVFMFVRAQACVFLPSTRSRWSVLYKETEEDKRQEAVARAETIRPLVDFVTSHRILPSSDWPAQVWI